MDGHFLQPSSLLSCDGAPARLVGRENGPALKRQELSYELLLELDPKLGVYKIKIHKL